MTRQTAVLALSARIVRWRPPVAAGSEVPECRTAWRDNVTRRQEFGAAHPDVIWTPRHGLDEPRVAYAPMPDGTFLEVTDTTELGRLLDKLAVAVAQRDAQSQQAA
jgi:hypothetical protein